MIFPCIDLMNGKVVQLVQGKAENKKVEIDDVDPVIDKFKGFDIQVIDLDAAMNNGNNYELIKKIISKVKCRVGGGIRTVEKAQEVLSLGVEKVVIGSSVFNENGIDFDFLKELNEKISKDKIIIAVDSLNGEVVIKGWKQGTGLKVEDAVKELERYCSEFLATYVDKEGMMEGTNLEFYSKLRSLTTNAITAAGGISSVSEIKELEGMGINSALGMAVYTGKIDLEELR